MLLAVVSWPAKRKMNALPRISGVPIEGYAFGASEVEEAVPLAVIRGARLAQR